MKPIIITSALLLIYSLSTGSTILIEGESFTKIIIKGNAKINLQQDSVCSVKYSGDDNSERANTSIAEGTLTIRGTAENDILVSLPDLKEIEIDGRSTVNGYGTITAENVKLEIAGSGNINLDLHAKKIEGTIPGFGKMILSGSTEESTFSIPGSGKIDAIDLKTIRCNADISGFGKITIDAIDELNTRISGSGSVTYKTTPKKMNEDISGMGKIKSSSGDNYMVESGSDTTRFEWGKNQIWVIGHDNFFRNKHKVRPVWTGFEMGINSYLNHSKSFTLGPGLDDFELRLEKSIYVALNLIQTEVELGRSNIWLLTGLGITWNNYRFDNDVVIDNGAYITTHRDSTPGVVHVKSKLVASYLTAPLMLEVFTSRNGKKALHFDAGIMLGMRIGSHTKRKYDYDSNDTKLKEFDQFNLSPFRFGFRAAIGFGKINVFADYYASTLFRDNTGPTLYPVDAGITLVGF